MNDIPPIEYRIARVTSILSNIRKNRRTPWIESDDFNSCFDYGDTAELVCALIDKARSNPELREGIEATGYAEAWSSIYDAEHRQKPFDF